MKHLILSLLLTGSLVAGAQGPLSYTELLAISKEISLSDSLLFQHTQEESQPLDSSTVKKWFPQLLPAGANNKFKNRLFSLTGKITSHENFDLLIVTEEKKKSDSSGTRVIYLVSVKKSGEFIASLKAAVSGTKKKTGYHISSCLYKDYKIVQDSRITTNSLSYNDMAWYKINATGRFISYPQFD